MKLRHINLMNVLMCFCVITIHLTSQPVMTLQHDSVWYFLFFILNKLCSFAVPAFIFLSGFKLYHKYKDSSVPLKKFYVGRLKKIIFPYFVAFWIYFIFFKFENLVRWEDIPFGLLLGTLVAHFYYIIIAIQFYLLFPVILNLFKKWDKPILLISFVCTIAFNQFISFEYSDRFFATYLLYFVLGMLLAKYCAEKKVLPSWAYYTAFLLLSIVHIYLCYQMSLGSLWYRFSGIGQVVYAMLACILIYNACLSVHNKRIDALVEFINPHTFYIFLYHILIMNILQFAIFPHFLLSIKFQFIITFLVVWGVVLLYCWIKNSFQKAGSKSNHSI